MKGIILAGGSGTRLYPLTKVISKQLLPVYDKPMIYYPLSTLILAGIKDILIISTPRDILMFQDLLGDGNDFGVNLKYEIQQEPNGLAEAFIIGETFIGGDSVCLILGDNIFNGGNLLSILEKCSKLTEGATIFGYLVDDPKSFGVVEFDDKFNVLSIEEKPEKPKSNYIVPGLYFYDNDVIKIAKSIKPSDRGELEITSINNEYLIANKLKVEILDKDVAWFDAGTFENLKKASDYMYKIKNLKDYPELPDIAETGMTFEENARLKAEQIAEITGEVVIGDDSGLCVDVLGGLPGVWSHRFAGPNPTDEENIAKLLHELASTAITPERRTAHFHTTLVAAYPGHESLVVEADWQGRIGLTPQGENGFGYDPIFLVGTSDRTAAQLSAEEKNTASHRGQALQKLMTELPEWLEHIKK